MRLEKWEALNYELLNTCLGEGYLRITADFAERQCIMRMAVPIFNSVHSSTAQGQIRTCTALTVFMNVGKPQ